MTPYGGKALFIGIAKITIKTLKLSCDLQIYMSAMDDDLLNKKTQQIFQKHIIGYVEIRSSFLTSKYFNKLEKFYLSKKHQKKQTQCFQELKRDMQVLIGTRANINIAQIEDYGGETFLSEELAVKILRKANVALKSESDLPADVIKLNDILFRFVMHEHVNYTLEVGLHAVSIVESTRTMPQLHFLDVVQKTYIIVHSLDSQCNTNIPKYSDYLFKKRILIEQMESKLDQSFGRTINAIIGWVKLYLQNEQKITSQISNVDTISSAVCLHVDQNLQPIIQQIKICMVKIKKTLRLHRIIYDHLQTMQFNTAGAMCAIFDVNEYRKCIRELENPIVIQLFDILHAICNLLVNYLDKSVVRQFIRLRADFRLITNTNYIKGILERRISTYCIRNYIYTGNDGSA
uniref:Exocyst complex component Sec10-like alpha-helical bundle domain-containing protein n=1 Tax=Glossina austeni TaxID=7395 RepID=A0A1A9UZA5_GLOAU